MVEGAPGHETRRKLLQAGLAASLLIPLAACRDTPIENTSRPAEVSVREYPVSQPASTTPPAVQLLKPSQQLPGYSTSPYATPKTWKQYRRNYLSNGVEPAWIAYSLGHNGEGKTAIKVHILNKNFEPVMRASGVRIEAVELQCVKGAVAIVQDNRIVSHHGLEQNKICADNQFDYVSGKNDIMAAPALSELYNADVIAAVQRGPIVTATSP